MVPYVELKSECRGQTEMERNCNTATEFRRAALWMRKYNFHFINTQWP